MQTLQESEVLKRRLDAAKSALNVALQAMDTKDGMMHWLETGTTHLGLLVSLGASASEVSPSDYEHAFDFCLIMLAA